MTRVFKETNPRIIIIEEESERQKCELCGKEAETRPYGPNAEEVCFKCGMKNEDAAKRQFDKVLFGNIGHS